jgi:hypothetical protein
MPVTKIIKSRKPRTFAHEIPQANLVLIKDPRIALERAVLKSCGITVTQSADTELMEVIVPPVEGRLDRQMKLMKVPIYRHDETATDFWLNVVERNSGLDGVGYIEHEAECTSREN